MKEKNVEAILYSTVGIAAMFVVLIAFYVVTSPFKQRVDLTAEKAFTLSAGTRHILAKLDSPVTLRYYCSQAEMPPELKPYAQEIEDLLDEYQQAGKGKIVLEKLDPKPDSDAEDSARLNGVEGEPLEMGGSDRVYLGLSVSQLDTKVAIPSWLDLVRDPARERLLEYEVSRAISRVINPAPATIGIMSALPVMGEEANPMLQRMGQQGQPASIFVNELKRDFNVVEVPMTAAKIDDNIKVLLVDHPRGITDTGQYAIDQFIMRGGKVIALLDPSAYFDPQHDQMEQVLGHSSGQSSLPKLLKAWGLEMDLSKVLADADASMRNPQSGSVMPAVLLVTRKGVNENDIVTGQIDTLLFPFAGAFTGKPADGLTETVLVQTSTNAEMVESIIASMNGEQILKDFKGTGARYAVALRLNGKFKTAFPEGKPAEAPPTEGEAKPAAADAAQLKESTNTTVILVADTDFLADSVCFNPDLLRLRIAQPVNGNANLLLNAVGQLAGDNDLTAIRSRGGLNRPFTVLQDLEFKASRQWQETLKGLEAKRNETQQKISALQAAKQGGAQTFILSPEQQKELQNYQSEEAGYAKQLRQIQKNLRKDTDSLQTTIRVVNIGAMPALVALTGIVLSVVKRKRTAAK
jgi:ABC-type uncharacterized transport system involved in gliding motility auxiliary subunit